MIRTTRANRTHRLPASHRARGEAPREPSITRLGFTCFRLIAVDGDPSDVVTMRLASSGAAMAVFAQPRETRRARFQQRVTRMDRIIRETLAMHAVHAS